MKNKQLKDSLEFATGFLSLCPQLYKGAPDNLPGRYGALTLVRLLENNTPIEVVPKSTLRFVLENKPINIQWNDLVWRDPAVLFIVPRGFIEAPEGGSVEFVTVARNDAYKPFQVPGCPVQYSRDDSIMVCAGGRGMDIHGINVTKNDFPHVENAAHIECYADEGAAGVTITLSETDRAFEFHLFRVGLGLLQTLS
jgi:hypothetical protein